MSFNSLLIHTCDIQEYTTSTSGYETTKAWANKAADVPCRKTANTRPDIQDTEIRVNTDDDLFSFKPDVDIERGDRIVYEGNNFDVVKINKVYGGENLHHITVMGRLATTD